MRVHQRLQSLAPARGIARLMVRNAGWWWLGGLRDRHCRAGHCPWYVL